MSRQIAFIPTVMRRHVLSLVLACTAALPASGAASAAEPVALRLCQDIEDVYPWTLKSRPGLNNILLKIVEAKLGLSLTFVLEPWKRCQQEMKAGTVDGMFAISFLAERQQFGVYPMNGDLPDTGKRLMSDGYSLFRRRGDASVRWDGKVLHVDGPVGAQRGYSVNVQLQRLGVQVDAGTYPVEENLRKLMLGRLAAVALRTLEGDSMLLTHRDFSEKIEKLPQPLAEKPYYLMLSHQFVADHDKLAAAIWDTLQRVRESPEYRVMENSYR